MQRFAKLPLPLRAYILVVAATAALLVVHLFWQVEATAENVALFTGFLLITGIVAALRVPVGLPGQQISLDVAVISLAQASCASVGTPVAALCAGAGALVSTYVIWPSAGKQLSLRPNPLHRGVFNASACIVAGGAAGFAYEATNGLFGYLGTQAIVPALVVWSVVYFLVNTGTIALVLSLNSGKRADRIWKDSCLWTAPGYIAAASLAGFAMALWSWSRLPPLFALLTLPLFYFIHFRFREHAARAELQQAHIRELNRVMESVMASLGMAIEAKDRYTRQHILRVQRYSVALAEAAGVPDDEREAIRLGALVHDVGKIAIPERILSKPGKLTAEEFTRMKAHVVIGAKILEPVEFPYPVVAAVRAHHERWDGLGYPDGLHGEEIPISGRIIAVADLFDALTSDRPYRRAMETEEALQVVRSSAGTQLDPHLVELFCELCRNNPGLVTEDLSDRAARLSQLPDEVFVEIAEAATADLSPAFDLIDTLIHTPDGDMLRQAVEGLRLLVPCATAIAFEPTVQGDDLLATIVSGEFAEVLDGMSIRVGEGVSGRAAKDLRPYMNASAMLDVARVFDPGEHIPLSSVLCVPVVIQGRAEAVLSFYHPSYEVYRESHQTAVQTVARHLAAALELRRQSTEGQALAMTDPGTGLPNLRRFLSSVESRLPVAAAAKEPLALLLMDLDQFKPINDRFGHLAGDEAIQAVARQLARCVDSSGLVCRYAGDEFVFLLEGLNREEADTFAQRVRTAVREVRVPGDGRLSCSVGVAMFPEDGNSVKTLLAHADMRMYEDKARARRMVERA
jgi:diguanylate cyclase (GGDEF)-like protein/putative nucleotidyltransferase with HDIG domain